MILILINYGLLKIQDNKLMEKVEQMMLTWTLMKLGKRQLEVMI